MIKIESLEKACPECGGYGRIENPNWSQFWSSNEQLKQSFWSAELAEQWGVSEPSLLEQPHEPICFICKNCHGRGKVLTEDGAKLIEFIHFWINPNYQKL